MSDLKGYKKCKNGHYYDENLERCPYCPPDDKKTNDDIYEAKTKIELDIDNDQNYNNPSSKGVRQNNANTKVYDNKEPDLAKTRSYSDDDFSKINKPQKTMDVSKTIIIDDDDDIDKPNNANKEHLTRKLTGWLVSYTVEKQGIDFKLFEGRNTLGHLPSNNICIPNDKSISGHHLTILFRNGKFKLRDELSANGTFINGKEIDTGVVYKIEDGDKIKVGNTIFIFKTPFPLNMDNS